MGLACWALASPATPGRLSPSAWGKRPRRRRAPLPPAAPEPFAWQVGRRAGCSPRPAVRGRSQQGGQRHASAKSRPVDFFGTRPAVRSCPAFSGLRGEPLLQAPPQLAQLLSAHQHQARGHRCRRRLLAGHQPRPEVARQCQQRWGGLTRRRAPGRSRGGYRAALGVREAPWARRGRRRGALGEHASALAAHQGFASSSRGMYELLS